MVLRAAKFPALQRHTASVDAIAGNEDLLIEILLYLPPKSLVRFQSVSKKWLSLISDPQFRRRHHILQNPNSPPTAVFYCLSHVKYSQYGIVSVKPEDEKEEGKKIPFLDEFLLHRWPVNPHYCNGLFCFQEKREEDNKEFLVPNCFVCNTTTHQYKKLPPLYEDLPPIYDRHGSRITYSREFNLAFDPYKSHHFRVVCVWRSFMHGHSPYYRRIFTYKSETNMWNESGVPPRSDCQDYFFQRAVYLNGAIHWVSESRPFLRFDVEDECFKPMPSTPNPRKPSGQRTRHIKYFGEAGGNLYLIQKKESSKNERVSVFQMKSDYSRWFPKCTLNLNRAVVRDCCIFSLVVLEGNAGVLLSGPRGRLVWGDFARRNFRELPQKLTMELSWRNDHWTNFHHWTNYLSHYSVTISSV